MDVSTLWPADASAQIDRRGALRRLAAEPTLDGRAVVEAVTADELAAHKAAWVDLCSRALDRNIFAEPDFMLPLLQHVGARRRLTFLLVWEAQEPASIVRLLGLFPIEPPRSWVSPVARGFAHEQTCCGTPLVDRRQSDAVFEALMTWLDALGGASALVLSGVAGDGPFLVALRRFCDASGRQLAIVEEQERAVLHRATDGDGRVTSFASAKRRKEQARQRRRLSESGARSYTSATSPEDVAAAMEQFLALEQAGWKGARGTAFLSDRSLATFARTMVGAMAREGRCRIDSIDIDGRSVAMGIVLSCGERAYFWKTTFDETYASLSPGVQFVLELTQAQLAVTTIALTDSCAIPDHPMIDRLWPDRAPVVDLILSVRSGADRKFHRSLRSERVAREIRGTAKRLWHRIRKLGSKRTFR